MILIVILHLLLSVANEFEYNVSCTIVHSSFIRSMCYRHLIVLNDRHLADRMFSLLCLRASACPLDGRILSCLLRALSRLLLFGRCIDISMIILMFLTAMGPMGTMPFFCPAL